MHATRQVCVYRRTKQYATFVHAYGYVMRKVDIVHGSMDARPMTSSASPHH